jgi:hypothetical protein
LQETINKLLAQTDSNSVPSGFGGGSGGTTPAPISGDSVASAGAEGDGWMSAGATFALDTSGVPGEVGTVSAQGGGPGVLLQGATMRLNILTTKGDLITHDGTNPVRHEVALDGMCLTADSSSVDGISWLPIQYAVSLGANQDDYSPSGLPAVGKWFINATVANVNITGILTGPTYLGTELTIFNWGVANTVTMKHNNAGSAVGHRLRCPGAADVVLAPLEGACLTYVAGQWLVSKLWSV